MSDEKERKEGEGRRGSWVWEMYQYTPHCSICGGDGLRGPANGPRFNFCPHCGADMREKREERGPGGLRIVEVEEAEADAVGRRARGFDEEAGLAQQGILFRCRYCTRLRRTSTFKRTDSGHLICSCPRCGEATVIEEGTN